MVPVKLESICCGCTACMSVCPKGAISMQPNERGFALAIINEDLCVGCNLCRKVCAFEKNNVELYGRKGIAKAAIHKSEDVRRFSRSGGVFMTVAKYVCDNQGIVYGAALDNDMVVRHSKAVTYFECKKFQGSKYVQSELNSEFLDIAIELKNGKTVLFSGTACQVDGLLSYLRQKKIDSTKLITCDIICHGVASPKMFSDYLKWIEKKGSMKGHVTEFDFRDKSVGWIGHVESYCIGEKKVFARNYTELYHSCAAFRKACYACPYTKVKRVSDFTLADCWGAEKKLPELFDNKGISLLLINSNKGEEIFCQIQEGLIFKDICIDDFMQPQLIHPVEKSSLYEEFWDDYLNRGFEFIIKKYGKYNLKDNVKRWIRWHVMHQY